MAQVVFLVNQLQSRDPALARRFEKEIQEAAATADPNETVECRILIADENPSLVRIQFGRPGWVKAFPPVSVEAPEGEVRSKTSEVLRGA
jgi:hypothetical protein